VQKRSEISAKDYVRSPHYTNVYELHAVYNQTLPAA
jgi:hypothetical protein